MWRKILETYILPEEKDKISDFILIDFILIKKATFSSHEQDESKHTKNNGISQPRAYPKQHVDESYIEI